MRVPLGCGGGRRRQSSASRKKEERPEPIHCAGYSPCRSAIAREGRRLAPLEAGDLGVEAVVGDGDRLAALVGDEGGAAREAGDEAGLVVGDGEAGRAVLARLPARP